MPGEEAPGGWPLPGVRLTQQKAPPAPLVNFPPCHLGSVETKGAWRRPASRCPSGCLPGRHGSRGAGGGALQVADAKYPPPGGVGAPTRAASLPWVLPSAWAPVTFPLPAPALQASRSGERGGAPGELEGSLWLPHSARAPGRGVRHGSVRGE